MYLLIKLHPRMTLLLIGILMINLLRMKPLLLRGRHLRLKISCSPTHSKTSLLSAITSPTKNQVLIPNQ